MRHGVDLAVGTQAQDFGLTSFLRSALVPESSDVERPIADPIVERLQDVMAIGRTLHAKGVGPVLLRELHDLGAELNALLHAILQIELAG